MLGDTPRKIIDGKVYHLHCGWKLEQEAIRDINADKGETYADTVSERCGGDASVSPQRDERGAPDSEGHVSGVPTPLHWTSHQ